MSKEGKDQLKMGQRLKCMLEAIKILEENLDEMLQYVGVSEVFIFYICPEP
jgi:hypothetical protein